MRTGEILDLGLQVYRKHAVKVLGATAGPMLLIYAGLVFWSSYVSPNLWTTQSQGNTAAEIGEVLLALATGVLVCIPILAIGLALASGTLVRIAASYIRGDDFSFEQAKKDGQRAAVQVAQVIFLAIFRGGLVLIGAFMLLALSRILRDVGGGSNSFSLLLSVFAVLAFFLSFLIVPWVLHTVSLTPAIVVIEGLPAKAAFRRCRDLLRPAGRQPGGFGTNFGLAVMLLLAWLFYAMGLGMIIGMFDIPGMLRASGIAGIYQDLVIGAVEMLPSFLGLWLVLPVAAGAWTAHYFDRRVRLEAYDVTVLTEDINSANQRAAASG